MTQQDQKGRNRWQCSRVVEVNLDEEGSTGSSGKFKATYYQGFVTELTLSTSAEDATEISMTMVLMEQVLLGTLR